MIMSSRPACTHQDPVPKNKIMLHSKTQSCVEVLNRVKVLGGCFSFIVGDLVCVFSFTLTS